MTAALLLLGSANTYAASSASAVLENVQVRYLSGEEISLMTPALVSSLFISGTTVNGFNIFEYKTAYAAPQSEILLGSYAGASDAKVQVEINADVFKISAQARALSGEINASSLTSSAIAYKANSLLLISADAVVSGIVGNQALGTGWDGHAVVSIYDGYFVDGAYVGNSSEASLFASSNIIGGPTRPQQLNLYYYNTVDTTLGVSFRVGASAVAYAVPEPSTYAMLGLGLAVLGFAARRRLS